MVQASKTYSSIFLNKWAERWVRQKGFVTRQLQKAFLLTTQKLPIIVFNFQFKQTNQGYNLFK
jgi:hypothetical protein